MTKQIKEPNNVAVKPKTAQETKEYMPEVGEEWKGEGIPPKGLVCLIRFKVDSTPWSGWRKGYFKGGYDSKIWLGQSDLQADDLIMFSHDVEFKPLPTKQEVEREEQIKELLNDAVDCCDAIQSGYALSNDFAKLMHEKGYRKVENNLLVDKN